MKTTKKILARIHFKIGLIGGIFDKDQRDDSHDSI